MGEAIDLVQKEVLELVTRSVEEKLDIDDFYDKLQKLTSRENVTKALVDRALVETFWLLWIRLDSSKGGERHARLLELMKNCVQDKKVDKKVAMEVLELDCLFKAGIVPLEADWSRKQARYTTRVCYTIVKYNLLREDSEGYARLIVALNLMGDAAVQPKTVEHAYKEIQALIGYFDLDPNRVLDLVLDAAEVQPENRALRRLVPLFKKNAVVHLLGFKFQHHQAEGAAPAWPRLPLLAAHLIHEGLVDLDELLGHLAPADEDIRQAQEAAMAELQKAVSDIGVVRLNAPTDRTAITGGSEAEQGKAIITVQAPVIAPPPQPPPPTGGGILAGIRAGQPYGMAASGHTSAPYGTERGSGVGMGDRGAYGGDNRGGGPGMGGRGGAGGFGGGGGEEPALRGDFKAQAGLKADQLQLDPAKTYEALLLPKDAARNQKLALAQALLQVGAWEHAQALLGRLDALGVSAAAWPPISETLCRMVKEELQPIFSCLAPRGAAAQGILDAASQVMDKVGCTGGSAAIRAGLPSHCKVGPPLSERGVAALLVLGAFLSRQPSLMIQVIQAVRHHYLLYSLSPSHASSATENGTAMDAGREAARVDELLRLVLLPASCLVPSMPAVSLELWQLLRLLPFTTRYRLYTDLKEQVERHPYLSAAAKLAAWETRKVLKRLHSEPDKQKRKEACKPHGRLLAKIAAANPISVLDVIVAQVEAYLNQMEPIIEALRYLTPLGLDALTYVILTRLSMHRDKVKDDGINISDWLQSLAKFTGAVCKKHNQVDNGLDIRALCQFLVNTLRGGDSVVLLVLKEMVETLTGISIQPDMSTEQLEGNLGGEALSSYVLMLDPEKMRRHWARGARRLLEALQTGPPQAHLALPVFISVAQERQAIMVHAEAHHIKFMVELYDRCHETCQQYVQFLQAALSFEDYVRLMPSIHELRVTYKLNPEIVYMAHRKLLRRLLDTLQAANPPAEEGEIEEPGEHGEIEPNGDSAADTSSLQAGTAASNAGGDVIMGDANGRAVTDANGTGGAELVAKGADVEVAGVSWQQVLAQVQASATNPSLFDSMTPYLYTLFWTLTVHDIHVPNKAYEVELEKARSELRTTEGQMSAARAGAQMSEDELLELGRQRERLKDLVKRMPVEQEQQAKHVEEVRGFIAREKDKMLIPALSSNEKSKEKDKTKSAAVLLVQECILPRVLCSPLDAIYCAKFAELLNAICLPYFSTVWYYNQLVKDIIPALRCITDHEAVNMGIFLLETFRLLNYWRSSEQVYTQECATKPGFSIKLTPSAAGAADDEKTTYDQYKALVNKWHVVSMGTIKACLESSEHTSRRNALTILNRVLPVFPVSRKNVDDLRKILEKVREEEKREDLAVMLKSYMAAFTAEMSKEGRVIPTELFSKPPQRKVARKPVPTRAGTPNVGPGSPGRAANGAAQRPAPARPASAPAPSITQPVTPPGAGNGQGLAPSRFRPEAPEFKAGEPGHPSPAKAPAAAAAAATAGAAGAAPAEGQPGGSRVRAAAEDADAARTHKRLKTEPAPSEAGAKTSAPAAGAPGASPPASRPAVKREPSAPVATGPTQTAPASQAAAGQPTTKRPRIEPPPPRVEKEKGDRDNTEKDTQAIADRDRPGDREGRDKAAAKEQEHRAGRLEGGHKDREGAGREKEGDKDREPAGKDKDKEGKREGRKEGVKDAVREEGKEKDEKKEKRREEKKDKEDKKEKRRDKEKDKDRRASHEGKEDSPGPALMRAGKQDREEADYDRGERYDRGDDRERRDRSRESRGDRGVSRDAPSRDASRDLEAASGAGAGNGKRRHRDKEHTAIEPPAPRDVPREASPEGAVAVGDLRNLLASRGSARLGDDTAGPARLSRQGSEHVKEGAAKPSAGTSKSRRR